MSRPKKHAGKRVSTAVRLPEATHTRLAEAAEERDVSMSWLMNRAVIDFLDRLIPVDEIVLTRRSVEEGKT